MALDAPTGYGQSGELQGATPGGVAGASKRACVGCGEALYLTELTCWKCGTVQPHPKAGDVVHPPVPESSAPPPPQPVAPQPAAPQPVAPDEMDMLGPIPSDAGEDPGPTVKLSGLDGLPVGATADSPAPEDPIVTPPMPVATAMPAMSASGPMAAPTPPPMHPNVAAVSTNPDLLFDRASSSAAADARANTSLVYGLIAFLCVSFLGPVAIWHGVNARREGSQSASAIIGIVLGSLATLGMVAGIVMAMVCFGAAMSMGPVGPAPY